MDGRHRRRAAYTSLKSSEARSAIRTQAVMRAQMSRRMQSAPRLSLLVIGGMLLAFWGLGAEADVSLSTVVRRERWEDCLVSPEDEWVEADELTIPSYMRLDYERRYTCMDPEGARTAASYQFSSKCVAQSFDIDAVQSCLRGRRVILLGDSLTTQQAESLVTMLGWRPHWIDRADPGNNKWMKDENGNQVHKKLRCNRNTSHPPPGCEWCFDVYEHQFTSENASDVATSVDGSSSSGNGQKHEVDADESLIHDRRYLRQLQDDADPYGSYLDHPTGASRDQEVEFPRTTGALEDYKDSAYVRNDGGDSEDLRHVRRLEEEEEDSWEDDEAELPDEISIHNKMFPAPNGNDWVTRAVAEFGEPRPSDVYIFNFGAHYHRVPDHEAKFKADVGAVLDAMVELAETSTVVWREQSATHFPATNGTWDNFLPYSDDKNLCCTGIPMDVDPRNTWAESYLKDNWVDHKVKILRIFDMSVFRGAAHQSCRLEGPSQPGSTESTCLQLGKKIDCTHWSTPGVVEEWNKMLLTHLCSVD